MKKIMTAITLAMLTVSIQAGAAVDYNDPAAGYNNSKQIQISGMTNQPAQSCKYNSINNSRTDVAAASTEQVVNNSTRASR